MQLNKPYFMTNDEWYTYDDVELDFQLTDKAPPEAIESYNEYMKSIKRYEDETLIDDDEVPNKIDNLFGF